MRFAYSEELEEFRTAIRGLFERHVPHVQLPELVGDRAAWQSGLWSAMAQQLGLQGLIVPEEHEGAGYGPVELALVMEEAGYALLTGPLYATTALAVPVLLHSGDAEAQGNYLPQIAGGELVVAVETRAGQVRAAEDSGSWKLTGHSRPVLSADDADLVIVSAETEGGPTLFAVRTDAAGVEREVVTTLDPSRPAALLHLNGAVGDPIGSAGAGADILAKAYVQASVALAAEQVGGAQRCLDVISAYARDRVQFGRAIGSFQGVKHQCANMMIAIEGARAAVWYAAWALANGADDAETAASVAKATASETYTFAARTCIQLLGGIGYTWEHPAQLHLKRATASEQLLGSPAEHFARVADALIDGTRPLRASGPDGGSDFALSEPAGAPQLTNATPTGGF